MVSISIVSYNTKDSLKECLLSIYHNIKALEYEIIVVDNASTDSTLSMIETEFPDVKLIKNERNLFFTRANNQAIRESRARYILLLNSDTLFFDNSLKYMVEFMEHNPSAGAVSGRILCERTGVQGRGWKFHTPGEAISSLWRKQVWETPPGVDNQGQETFPTGDLINQIPTSEEVDVVSDGFILVRRRALFQINLYDERFLLYYTEDDLCHRLKDAGWKIFYLPSAGIVHKLFGSSKNLPAIKILFIGILDGVRYYNKYYGLIPAVIVGLFFFIDFIRRICNKIGQGKNTETEKLTAD